MMGTWAAGVYGNDSALDWVGDLVDGIQKAVRSKIANFDENDGDWLLAAVDTMYIVCKNAGGTAPNLIEVLQWRKSYCLSWDMYNQERDVGKEYIAAQCKIIDETFARLAALSKSFLDQPKQ